VGRARIGVVAGALALVVSACGGAGAKSASTSDPSPATAAVLPPVAVQVSDNEYTPAQVHAKVGQAVTWASSGGNPHDIEPADPAARWGSSIETLGQGGSYSMTFGEAGTYAYYCTIHGTKNGKGMAGVVVVDA
jgi:plastocyanin